MPTHLRVWITGYLILLSSLLGLTQPIKSWTIQIDLISYTKDSSILHVTAKNESNLTVFTPTETAIEFSTFTESGYLVFDISNPVIVNNAQLGGKLLESNVEMNFNKIAPQQVLKYTKFIKRNISCVDSIMVILRYFIPNNQDEKQFWAKDKTLKIPRNRIYIVFAEHSTRLSKTITPITHIEPETLYLGFKNPTPTKIIELKKNVQLVPIFKGSIVTLDSTNVQSTISVNPQLTDHSCYLEAMSLNKVTIDTNHIGTYKIRTAPKPALTNFYGIDSIISFQSFENMILKAYRFELPFQTDTVEIIKFSAFIVDQIGTIIFSKVISGNQFTDELIQTINQTSIGSQLILDNILGHDTRGSCNVKSKIIELRQ